METVMVNNNEIRFFLYPIGRRRRLQNKNYWFWKYKLTVNINNKSSASGTVLVRLVVCLVTQIHSLLMHI